VRAQCIASARVFILAVSLIDASSLAERDVLYSRACGASLRMSRNPWKSLVRYVDLRARIQRVVQPPGTARCGHNETREIEE
jgi:hypothetical protein